MLTLLLIAMLQASTPAVAEPARSIEGERERFDVDKKALQQKIYGESSGIGFTFCSAFVRSVTLGLSGVVVRQFGDQDFPMLDDARKINPRAAAAGTVLGGIVLAGIVYTSLIQTLLRRRARRKALRSIPVIEQSEQPDGIVGSFVTQDGHEFVVIRHSRKADNSVN